MKCFMCGESADIVIRFANSPVRYFVCLEHFCSDYAHVAGQLHLLAVKNKWVTLGYVNPKDFISCPVESLMYMPNAIDTIIANTRGLGYE